MYSPTFRVHILNLSKKTHWQGHINPWVRYIHVLYIDKIPNWICNYDCFVFIPTCLEHPSCPKTNVCEGARCGAVPASSKDLHRCHQQPAKQPAVCGFTCLCLPQDVSVIWCCQVKSPQFSGTYDITPTASFHPPSVSVPRSSFSISVQNLQDRSCFIMYEFWQDRLSWMRWDQRGFMAY